MRPKNDFFLKDKCTPIQVAITAFRVNAQIFSNIDYKNLKKAIKIQKNEH